MNIYVELKDYLFIYLTCAFEKHFMNKMYSYSYYYHNTLS